MSANQSAAQAAPSILMTVVYLIRHGQASFGKQDYDRLSTVGERQARVTGEHMRHHLPRLDRIFSGGMVRQEHSATIAREALGENAPPLGTIPGFAEYDHVALFKAYLPSFLAESGASVNSLDDLLGDHKLLERALRYVLASWLEGSPNEAAPMLSWSNFKDRTGDALDELLSTCEPDSRVAIFTSGGIITALLDRLLGLSAQTALGLAVSLYNASITQLSCPARHGAGGRLLVGYNNITHLEITGDRNLITFR